LLLTMTCAVISENWWLLWLRYTTSM